MVPELKLAPHTLILVNEVLSAKLLILFVDCKHEKNTYFNDKTVERKRINRELCHGNIIEVLLCEHRSEFFFIT